MYPDALPYLCCPACARHLTLAVVAQAADGEVLHGTLSCAGCGARYPIHAGIADFLGPPQPPTPAQVVNETRLAGWGYERLWRPYALTLLTGERFPYRHELPFITALADAGRGGFFVDVACSNGLYTRALTRAMSVHGASGHVLGIDHSLPMLRDARRRARATRLRISYGRAKAQALPVRAGVAEGIVIGGSLNEIGAVDDTLDEARRVLADDGRFVAMTLTRAQSAWGWAMQALLRPGGVEFRSADNWIAAFEQHGLHTVGRWEWRVVLFTLSEPSRTKNTFAEQRIKEQSLS